MNYGSASYGSASYGGAAASEWYTFFPYLDRAEGLYEAEAEFIGSGFFSVFAEQSNGEIFLEYKVYTFNDVSETPQLQVTFSGRSQAVVGAARFIRVTALLPEGGETFSIRGRSGD